MADLLALTLSGGRASHPSDPDSALLVTQLTGLLAQSCVLQTLLLAFVHKPHHNGISTR